MAMYCLNMLAIALELAQHNCAYEDVGTKFFEHFLYIAHAANNVGGEGISLWNDDDGFFYDVLRIGEQTIPLRVRSFVGLIPLFAVEANEPRVFEKLPDFADRVKWFQKNRPDLCSNIFTMNRPGVGERRLMSLVGPDRLRRILARMLDEREFLSANGLRSLSKIHEAHPVSLMLDGHDYSVGYQPGESTTGMFGGNSNWRGPVWFPVNYLMIESLQRFHHYLGPEFTVEMPTGSGDFDDLSGVAAELSRRLIGLFLAGEGGRPSNGGHALFDHDPYWRDQVTFYEYFHGDSGKGLGAAHQTGWTALVAKLIRQSGSTLE
jgi:hypothetical protein